MAALNFPDAPSPGQDFQNWQWDGTKWIVNPSVSSGSKPAGTDKQVQFNDAGAFAGNANLTYDKTTSILHTALVQLSGTPTQPADVVDKQFVDANFLSLVRGGSVVGDVVVGTLTSNGEIRSQGGSSIVSFLDRVTNEQWSWYASGGVGRLFHPAGGGDIWTITQNGSLKTLGSITIPVGSSFFFAGATSGGTGRIICDGTSVFISTAADGGSFLIQNSAGSINNLQLDGNGNLTIVGATATKASGTTWANPSARDLKENIQPYQAGLDAILALQPRTWDFAADSGIDAEGPHIGLVYDETAHMPEMHRKVVIGGGAGELERKVDGLDCSAVTWALVNTIKELNGRLAALEDTVGKIRAL